MPTVFTIKAANRLARDYLYFILLRRYTLGIELKDIPPNSAITIDDVEEITIEDVFAREKYVAALKKDQCENVSISYKTAQEIDRLLCHEITSIEDGIEYGGEQDDPEWQRLMSLHDELSQAIRVCIENQQTPDMFK